MKKAALVLSALVLFGAATAPAMAGTSRPRLTGEAELAKLLEGREAGKPVSCISTFINRDSRIIDKTAIVWGSGTTLYVNRPDNARDLDDDDILIMRLTGNNDLCRVDTIRLRDRSSGMERGFVALGDFVPYTRVKKPAGP